MNLDLSEALRLAAALLLPWMAGTLWLYRWNSSTFAGRLSISLGYGYFLGMAACTVLLRLAYLLDFPPFTFTVNTLVMLTLASFPALHKQSNHRTPGTSFTREKPLFLALLLLIILAHLLPTLLEALVRPLYPWDAWTTWVYRAKVWFLNGELTRFLPPGTAGDMPHYELKAWNYPLFVSLTHLWPALALGRWSETLVNLPGWLAGLAVGLGLHGLCRNRGFSNTASTGLSALFFSIPLVDSHMLLPGYADIWMSGFVGLGFAALLATDNRRLQLLGLLFIACSPLVKKEGIAWLTAGLVFLAVEYRPRTSLALAGVTAAIALWVWHSGLSLPLVGTIAIENGSLVLEKLGDWPLQFHNVLPAFGKAFFLQGSWNLTWILVAIALLASLLRLDERNNRRVLLMMLLVMALLFAIFFLSPQSRWAADLTAINRLPLQILPALLLASFMIWRTWDQKEKAQQP